MTITKPTVGVTGWNTAVDAVIDKVNAADGPDPYPQYALEAPTGVHPLTGMIHAKGYGVVADGSTDDYTALAAAITAANTASGVAVLLPPGKIRYTTGLVLGNAHLIGQPGASASRSTPAALYGTTLAPAIAAADQAAITLTKGSKGCRVSGFALDMQGMANGSTNDPFTRSQTKGIHLDGAWNVELTDIYIKYVPTNAAAIFVDEGASTPLGAFWSTMRGVFIDQYTKRGLANGYVDSSSALVEAAKDQTARGFVFAGASIGVTAQTLIDCTSYRGIYLKNCMQFKAFNFHSENAPAHSTYIDGGDRISFYGGFFESAGHEAASGDATVYLLAKGANTPRLVSFVGCTFSGNGITYTEWGNGLVLDVGDPYGLSTGDHYKRIGAMVIDRAGAGRFTGNADARLLGPYSAGTAIGTASDSVVFGFKDVTNVATYDELGLYSNASGNFSLPQDTVDGVNCKIQVHFAVGFRLSSGSFAAGDWIDMKLVPASGMNYPSGAAVTIATRFMMAPSGTSQLLVGSFDIKVVNTFGSYFQLMARASRANVIPGLGSTDAERGYISYRQIA